MGAPGTCGMTTDFNFEVETKDVDNFMVSSRCASS
jgi:hypothetical protein